MQPSFTSADPDWDAKVRDSFARQGAMKTIGARLVHLEPGHAHVAVEYADAIAQQHGYVHGGVVGMIADTAGGYAGFSMMPPGASVLTVEYKMNLMNPADGTRIVARGRVVKPGRTLVVCQVDVYSIKESRMVETVAGLEYDGGCWIGRVVFQRLATQEKDSNTSFFVQLEFNGFAKVGTNPLEMLKRNVPGYGVINQQNSETPVYTP